MRQISLVLASPLLIAACAQLTEPPALQIEPGQTAPADKQPAEEAAAKPVRKLPKPADRRAAAQQAQAAQGEKIAASHILIGFKGARGARSDRSEAEALKLASELAKKARQGTDFAELAKKHSEGPSAPKGGDLGQFQRRQMVKPFADAAFELKPGEVSAPVKTMFGFHVIKRAQ